MPFSAAPNVMRRLRISQSPPATPPTTIIETSDRAAARPSSSCPARRTTKGGTGRPERGMKSYETGSANIVRMKVGSSAVTTLRSTSGRARAEAGPRRHARAAAPHRPATAQAGRWQTGSQRGNRSAGRRAIAARGWRQDRNRTAPRRRWQYSSARWRAPAEAGSPASRCAGSRVWRFARAVSPAPRRVREGCAVGRCDSLALDSPSI